MFPQILILLGVIAAGAVGAFLLIRAQASRKNLRAFAKSANLSIFYKNKQEYNIHGPYRTYEVEISPYLAPSAQKSTWTHVKLPMNNPNKKFIWFSQGMQPEDWKTAFKVEKFAQVKHELPTQIEILTSDLFFSSLLLSDQVKARAQHVFGLQDQLLVYLKDEALGALLPQGPESRENWKITAECMQFLSEIKDELNRN